MTGIAAHAHAIESRASRPTDAKVWPKRKRGRTVENDRDEEDDKGLSTGDAEGHACPTHESLVVTGFRESERKRNLEKWLPTDEDAVEENAHLKQHALHKRLCLLLLAQVALVRRDRRVLVLGLGRRERPIGVPHGPVDEVAAVVEVPPAAPVHLGERELDRGHREHAAHRDRARQRGVLAKHALAAQTRIEQRGERGREEVAECGPAGVSAARTSDRATDNGKRATDMSTPVPKCLMINSAFCGTRSRCTRVARRGNIAASVDTAMITNSAPTWSGLLYSSWAL